jgi:hypothetical protein
MSLLRLQTPIDCIPNLFHMCIKFVAPWNAVDGHMGATFLLSYACAGGGGFVYNWGMAEPESCCNAMVEAPNSRKLHPTSILDVYKVF